MLLNVILNRPANLESSAVATGLEKRFHSNRKERQTTAQLHSLTRQQSCPTLCGPWNSPGQNTRVGCLSLLQGIFPIQGSNPGLPHCRQVLYQLSHNGSPRTLEGVAYPFSRGSSLTQESNWVLPHCWGILYQLSYQ